jgi:hypothetical protein
MKRLSLSIILALSTLLLTFASLTYLTFGAQLTYATGAHYVAKDCSGVPLPCYLTIQAAIDAANEGDVIKVATGIYTDINNYSGQSQIAYISKTITVRGGYVSTFTEPSDPEINPTILNAEGKGRVLYITGKISPVIAGLQIIAGDASGLDKAEGGGIYLITATATISNNFVFNNEANFGGGIYVRHGEVRLYNNTIISNSVREGGGGFSADSSLVELSNNTVVRNDAGFWGGGFHFYDSSATSSHNVVATNTARFGGGIFSQVSNGMFNDNTIFDNDATFGGGVFVYFGTTSLSDNIISSNSAGFGGGLYLHRSFGVLTNTVITNNQVITEGAGLIIEETTAHLLHTTITCNKGGDGSGIHISGNAPNYSSVMLTNTILVSHTIGVTVATSNIVSLESTLWYNNNTNWRGAGVVNSQNNHSGKPAFAADGYHLGHDSTAINKGVQTEVTTDIDGEARNIGMPDLGADEAHLFLLYLPVIVKEHM